MAGTRQHPKQRPSPQKAREILRDGKVHGKPLTKAQKGFFGARAGNAPVKKKGKT